MDAMSFVEGNTYLHSNMFSVSKIVNILLEILYCWNKQKPSSFSAGFLSLKWKLLSSLVIFANLMFSNFFESRAVPSQRDVDLYIWVIYICSL